VILRYRLKLDPIVFRMMNLWLAKYAVQRVASVVPGGIKINEVLQKRLGGLRNPVLFGYPRTLTMLWLLRQAGVTLEDAVCVELGTGWDMSSAMTLIRTAACCVHTYDHVRHVVPELKTSALEQIEGKVTPLDADLAFEPPFEELRLLVGEPRGEVFYHAPHDARRTEHHDQSVDFYYSLATLEHVPLATLKGLLTESYRILKPGGYCYHYIQPAMHSWRGSESSVDYLVFSKSTWEKWIINPIAYENRMRAVEHIRLLQEAGFEIVRAWFNLDPRALAKIPRMKLAPEFTAFTAAELAQNYVWVIARKPN
jgi:SAM-dependent methyltransferase